MPVTVSRTSNRRHPVSFLPFPSLWQPRLIATDLDGTLLHSDQTVSQRTAAALVAAEKAGIDVFFVTGRSIRWMDVVSRHLASHGVAICSNGAAVYDLRRARLIEMHPLATENAFRVVRVLRAVLPNVKFAVERTDGFGHEPDYPLIPRDRDRSYRTGSVEKLLLGDSGRAGRTSRLVEPGERPALLKLLAKHPDMDPDAFHAIARTLAGAYAEFTRSGASPVLEISARGMSKATTLARCCAGRGVRPQEVVAFGDMLNDLQMLTWAGNSYAVANAHPKVLAAARHRTATNDDDGVAQVIEALIRQGRRRGRAGRPTRRPCARRPPPPC